MTYTVVATSSGAIKFVKNHNTLHVEGELNCGHRHATLAEATTCMAKLGALLRRHGVDIAGIREVNEDDLEDRSCQKPM